MSTIRQPAVAGLFYPADRQRLETMIADFLKNAENIGAVPKAIIAPHAGYVYSGPIAASAYAQFGDASTAITRVVLLGPAHTVAVRGLALSSAGAFATPLGRVPVDAPAVETISSLPQVHVMDEAHTQEHGLEVHLPFLQMMLSDFKLVPLVVGTAETAVVAEVIEKLWGGEETLVVISSDLSHYYDYDTARRMDEATAQAIVGLRPEAIGGEAACGRIPIKGLLDVARRHHLQAQRLDLRNSGDTAGTRDRVVGYGAFAFY